MYCNLKAVQSFWTNYPTNTHPAPLWRNCDSHASHGRHHHSSLGANAPWKIFGTHFSQSWENIDQVNFQLTTLNVIPNVIEQ